jgi:hypothetical protein
VEQREIRFYFDAACLSCRKLSAWLEELTTLTFNPALIAVTEKRFTTTQVPET